MASSPSLTPLGLAALALLAERPMHPYEMFQTLVQRREERVVKVRPGSLYHTIDRLAVLGYVQATGTEREGNRPERTTYQITEQGTSILSERIAEVIATPVNEFPEFPLAIGEAHNLPAGAVIALLRNRLALQQDDLDRLEADIRTLEAKCLPRMYWLNVEYTRDLLRTETLWLAGIIEQLESGDLPWLAATESVAALEHSEHPLAKELSL